MFQYHDKILCVQGGWLYGDGDVMTFGNYKSLYNRGWLNVVRRGCKGTPALVAFDSLPERFRNVIVEKYGDPHKTTKHNSFKDHLEHDLKAVEFYKNYTLDNGDALPEKNIEEYVANATVMNAIHSVVTVMGAKNRTLGGNTKKIWDKLTEIMSDLPKHTYPHSLPTNARRLKDKYKAYQQDGYQTFIHKGFCNDNSEKINDAAKVWLLSRWADRVAKVANMAQLLFEYNEMSKKKGWKPLKEERTLYIYKTVA